jgi:hypothetical protein
VLIVRGFALPPPADDDGDGVANTADKCPGTHVGEVASVAPCAMGCSRSQPFVCVTPGSGLFLADQGFEIGVLGNLVNVTTDDLAVRLNNQDISVPFNGCTVAGTLNGGASTTVRCPFVVTPAFLQSFLGGSPGPFTLGVTVNSNGGAVSARANGAAMADSATWQVPSSVAAPSLTLSPPSGFYLGTQRFDISLIIGAGGLAITSGSATFDGVDRTAELNACIGPGSPVAGAVTVICRGVIGASLGVGSHTLTVTVNLSNGASISRSVTWELVANAE